MKLGVLVFQNELVAGITDIARAVEDAGLDSLFVVESTHIPVSERAVFDGANRNGAHSLDPFTVLGAAAAVTSRLKLGTGVCLVAQHDPIILARRVATIDHLSGGRFLFGVGAGWRHQEMRNHGVQPRLRWRVMREKVLAMQAIWTQDEAEFHGQFVAFDPILSWPKPLQTPYPPLLVGGSGPLSLQAAAEYGDGWMPIIDDIATFEQQLAVLPGSGEAAPRGALRFRSLEVDRFALGRLAPSRHVGCRSPRTFQMQPDNKRYVGAWSCEMSLRSSMVHAWSPRAPILLRTDQAVRFLEVAAQVRQDVLYADALDPGLRQGEGPGAGACAASGSSATPT